VHINLVMLITIVIFSTVAMSGVFYHLVLVAYFYIKHKFGVIVV
jgi:hypothetical protein